MSNKITIEKIKERIEDKIKSTKDEYNRQLNLHILNSRYAEPDWGSYWSRLSALYEIKELINML